MRPGRSLDKTPRKNPRGESLWGKSVFFPESLCRPGPPAPSPVRRRVLAGIPLVLFNERACIKIGGGLPGVFCWGEPLPSHIVFAAYTPVFVPVCEDGLHFPVLFPLDVNRCGWRFRFVLPSIVRLQQGYLENRVYSVPVWEFQSVGLAMRAHDLRNFE